MVNCAAVQIPNVPPETLGSRPGSVVTGRDREVRGATHNWPSVARVREGLAGKEILVSSRTSDSCGGLGAVRAKPRLPGARCFFRHIGAAGFRVGLRCVKQWLGCVSEDA